MAIPSNFVKVIDLKLGERLMSDLKAKGFELSAPPYTLFCAKKKGVSCTLYTSGKLVVQGKEMAEFMEFYLEPLLGTFSYTYPQLPTQAIAEKPSLNPLGHIGIDESGKGDFFGPLCIAGVHANQESIQRLISFGIKDSKILSDASILKLAKLIKQECAHHIVKITPAKYNEIYEQFKNLNSLLAWGHATVIEYLTAKTGCCQVVVDQFANERVVLTAIKRKNLQLNLTQRHRAEEDVVVAAASILARETFLLGLEMLEKQFGLKLPKGASSATIAAGKSFVAKHGREALSKVGKLHFKTTLAI